MICSVYTSGYAHFMLEYHYSVPSNLLSYFDCLDPYLTEFHLSFNIHAALNLVFFRNGFLALIKTTTTEPSLSPSTYSGYLLV